MLSAASQAAIKLATAGTRFRGAQKAIGGTGDGGDEVGARMALLVSSASTWLRGRRRGRRIEAKIATVSIAALFIFISDVYMYICYKM
jgi:hypothetical protein